MPEPVDPPAAAAPAAGEVVFDGVRFGYGGATVLPHLDLTIPAGQTVALVGATGAGKSTLARLTARFYDPVAGQVRLDGVPLDRLADTDLRRAVVMVTQESFLFSGSVADNITFGKPEATRAEVEEAARAIGADDVHPGAAGGVRHRRRQARRPALGRAAPTGQLRPRVPRRPGGADPGRGDAAPSTCPASGWSSGRCRRCWPTGRR